MSPRHSLIQLKPPPLGLITSKFPPNPHGNQPRRSLISQAKQEIPPCPAPLPEKPRKGAPEFRHEPTAPTADFAAHQTANRAHRILLTSGIPAAVALVRFPSRCCRRRTEVDRGGGMWGRGGDGRSRARPLPLKAHRHRIARGHGGVRCVVLL